MIQRFEMEIPALQRTAMIDLYLPDEYAFTEERYPVFYMFDGQNLFDDAQATYGTSWGLKDFLDQSSKRFIMVGIECDTRKDNRLHEYTPYALRQTFFGPTEGRGKQLMEWMISTLKPFIDQNYRTWPQREATAIGGSSMGGLMAFYAVIHHNDVFSKAACLSPSVMICQEEITREFEQTVLNPDTRIYWSFGSLELSASRHRQAKRQLDEYVRSLASRGGYGRAVLVEGGKHNEATWRRQNPDFFHFLFAHPSQLEGSGLAEEDKI